MNCRPIAALFLLMLALLPAPGLMAQTEVTSGQLSDAILRVEGREAAGAPAQELPRRTDDVLYQYAEKLPGRIDRGICLSSCPSAMFMCTDSPCKEP